MVRVTFSDPKDQSAYDALKGDLKNKRTDITIQIKNLTKNYNEFINHEATRHEKKRLLTSIHYKTEAIEQNLNQLNDVTSKCMAQVMSMVAEIVSHKYLLEQETKKLEAELDTYGRETPQV